ADIAVREIPAFSDNHAEAEKKFRRVAVLAQEAIGYLPHNDAAHRAYLRAAYGLFALGNEASGEDFLQAFEDTKYIDGRFFNDFAAMAIDVFTRKNHPDEAQQIAEKLDLFLERAWFRRKMY